MKIPLLRSRSTVQSTKRCSLMHAVFAIRRSSTQSCAWALTIAIVVGMAGLAFVVGPSVMRGRIAGDIGDARLNSYITSSNTSTAGSLDRMQNSGQRIISIRFR